MLDAAQKLLDEASGARLEEAAKLVSPLRKLAHRREHEAKVRGPHSTSGPASRAFLTAASSALLGLADRAAFVLGPCIIDMVAYCEAWPLIATLITRAKLLATKLDSIADLGTLSRSAA